jgi:elongator complex protein 3
MSITLAKKNHQAIAELLKTDIRTSADLQYLKRKLAKKYQTSILGHSEILQAMEKIDDADLAPGLRRLLRKRSVRTLSGIAPVAVLTMSWPCPGKCAYCPTEKDVPQSYLSNEPAVMRAIRCGYDPAKQVEMRLRALEANGHEPNKIELIVIGGTWSVLPDNYKFWYIKECFRAANDFQKNQNGKSQNYDSKLKIIKLRKQLQAEQRRNEKAKYKIIGVTLETRPDYINEKELLQMRELGCTRVEIGVQAIDDKILVKNKRGHGVAAIANATKLLKDFGFKVTYHLMPGLPGATASKDFKMFKQLFSDERFQPDQIKFYPTIVTRGSLLYRWWQQDKYRPYSQQVLENLIVQCKLATPNYVRIIRLIRDIPGESIMAGNLITNLRQVMQQRGVVCKCIRCREVKDGKIKNYKLRITKYNASGGAEYFIEAVSQGGKTLFGFCRLRLAKDNLLVAALIRELHVYGELVPVGKKKIIQHSGLGKKLMVEAEIIAQKNGFKKIAVISGVGARNYYRKLGYRLKDTYMIKR